MVLKYHAPVLKVALQHNHATCYNKATTTSDMQRVSDSKKRDMCHCCKPTTVAYQLAAHQPELLQDLQHEAC